MSEPRLVDVSTSYVAPDQVVRELRAIDERAELLYVQRGKWWLGLVKENIPLIQMGRDELVRIKDEGGAMWPTIRLAQLRSQGFQRVILPKERWPREPMWYFIIEWFKKQDWVFRHIPDSDDSWEREFQRHSEAMEGTPEVDFVKNGLLDLAHADRKSLMRRIQRSPYITVKRAVNE